MKTERIIRFKEFSEVTLPFIWVFIVMSAMAMPYGGVYITLALVLGLARVAAWEIASYHASQQGYRITLDGRLEKA